MPQSDDFNEYRRLILSELERLDKTIQRNADATAENHRELVQMLDSKLRAQEVASAKIHEDFTSLKGKVALIGSIAAGVVTFFGNLIVGWIGSHK